LTDSLLTTKFFIPSIRQELVPRPRLIKQMGEKIHHKLTLISAPAGFGKTTLVTEWIENIQLDANPKIAWLSLDKGDNDFVRFLTYFITALNRAYGSEETFGEVGLSMLQSPQPPLIEAVLIPLINEITSISERIILVFDDYHVIESSQVDEILYYLIDHLPPQIQLVIVTREDPHLPLARLRSQNQLTEMRAEDLRFRSSEAAEFLNRVMGLNLSEEDITALEIRTEGWIAGLQLAAISLQGRDDASSLIESFSGSHRLVLDYLIEEVLNNQSEKIRTFLLKTALLDRLNGPLCDALTGQDNSQEILEMLELKNLFIIPLDGERQWYRYHHLFADLLLQRLTQNRSLDITSLFYRASTWYDDNGFTDKAIEYALRGEDFKRAAELLELAWPAMDESFQSDKWLGWVKTLPDKIVHARPVLSIGCAWAFLNEGQLDAADIRLSDAEYWLKQKIDQSEKRDDSTAKMVVVDKKQFQALPASIATIRGFLAQTRGDMPGTVKYAQQALDLLLEDEYFTRGRVAMVLGLASWSNGDLENAYQSLSDGIANMEKVGNLLFAISGTFLLADIRVTQGRLHEALKIFKKAFVLAEKEGEPILSGTEDLYRGISEIHFQQGNQEAAKQNIKRSEELSEEDMVYQYRLCITQAQILEFQDDLEGALNRLDEAERLYYQTPLPNLRPVPALKTRIWVRQGRLADALNWVHEQDLSYTDDLSFLHEFEHITLARVLIAQFMTKGIEHCIEDAIEFLDRLLEAAEVGGRIGSLIEILILQALAHEAWGDRSSALVSLERVLSLAEPERYIHIFVIEGPPMVQLLREAQNHDTAPEYVRVLLEAFPRTQSEQTDLKTPGSGLIEPLSEREIDVLELIAAGHKYHEIAEQLVISINTVRHHTKNIYSKLEVNNRTQAIKKANDLNLLQH
jgi:LuxR family maltose regulon positive regulatory protein